MLNSKKILSFFVSLSLVLNMFPIMNAYAAEKPKEVQKIASGGYEAVPFDTSNLQRSGKRRLRGEVRAKTFPASFRLFKGESDSADQISPKLKNQSDWGVCWTFSALGSAESSLYDRGSNDYDFSERHLAYFTYHGANNPNAPEDGTAGDTYVSSNPFEGGTFFKAIATLSRGVGVAWDKDVPYPAPSDFNGEDRAIGFETVAEKYHYDSHFQLKECDFLPDKDASGNLDGSAIKSALQSGTSVSCTYCSRAGDAKKYYTSKSGLKYPVYFCNSKGPLNADHAVQIVGWNDSIPASDFTDVDDGANPSKPGAWIIQNSWGAENAYRGGAYFYISYEDKTLTQFCTFTMDTNKDSPRYAHNYQYDGDGETSQLGLRGNTKAKAANVFTATGNQNLDAVAFYTTDGDANYSIQVYTDVTGTPDSGTKAFGTEQTGTEIYPGYHTVPLTKSVPLKSGQKFSVVISIQNPNLSKNPIAFECHTIVEGEGDYCVVGIKKGQSYFYNGASWQDMSRTPGYGNICLKALTNDSGKEPSGNITITPSSARIAIGKSQVFSAAVTGLKNSSVVWSVTGQSSKDTGIDTSGKLTVAADETAPTLTVKAQSAADASVYAYATVTVLTPEPGPSIFITSPSMSIARGKSQVFSAAVTGLKNGSVLWSVTGQSSKDTRIDTSGNLTVAADETAPTLTITAKSAADASVYSQVTITVLIPKPGPGITITPPGARVERGKSQVFSAAVTGLKNGSVVWSVTGQSSKDTGIDTSGKLTVAADETAPTLTITAKSAADASVYSQVTITVLVPKPGPGITITPPGARVERGKSQVFNAVVTGLPNKNVVWSVTGQSSKKTGIDTSGKLTVAADETAPTLTVRAQSAADASVYSQVTVTVLTPMPKASIVITPSHAWVNRGRSQFFNITVKGLANKNVVWSVTGNNSADTSFSGISRLNVAEDELATTLTVIATSVADSRVYATATVTVLPSPDNHQPSPVPWINPWTSPWVDPWKDHPKDSPTLSIPSIVTDGPTGAQANLSGAIFSAGITSVSYTVTNRTQGDKQAANLSTTLLSSSKADIINISKICSLSLLDQNGSPASFTGAVTVKVPIPAGIYGSPHVFRYEESTGTFTDMNAAVEDNFLVFSTTHFSYYAIAGVGNAVILDTRDYQMPVGGKYQISARLSGTKAASVKVGSTNGKVAAAVRLKNGNYLVTGKGTGTTYIMFDVYDSKNKFLTHASVRVDVKTGIRPRGDSTRQVGVF